MNTLGERIKHLRKSKELTLIAIAERMGVTEATVQRWESGNIKSLRHNRAVQLAKVLGCTPAYLMGWEEENAEPQKADPAQELSLNDNEQAMLNLFRSVPPEEQEALLMAVEVALRSKGLL